MVAAVCTNNSARWSYQLKERSSYGKPGERRILQPHSFMAAMRSFWGIIIGTSLLTGAAHGQVFERGYVVTTAGDTLRGELENRFWQGPPDGVTFRTAPDAPARLFPRTRVRAFRLEGGRYFRAEVLPLDRNAQTNVANLPTRLVITQRPDSLLAEVLVNGPVPLLRAVVDDVTHYFVQRPGQPFLELVERRYLLDTNGHQRIVNANNYRSQLTVYFGDCPAAVAAAGTASFSAKGLAAVVQAFSGQCTAARRAGEDLTVPARPHRPFAFNGGLLAGAVYNISQFDSQTAGEERPLLNNLDLDGRLHPFGGAYFDVLLPGRRWALHGEAALSTFGRRGTFPLANGAGSYTWYGTKIDTRLGARYMLKQTLQRELFAGAGLNFNVTTRAESREQYGTGGTRLTSLNVRVPTQASFIGAPPFGVGTYAEVGVRQGRFTLSVDGLLGDGIDYTDPLAVNTAVRGTTMPSSETSNYYGYTYRAHLFAFRAVLAYRLGQRPDQQAP